MQSSSKAHSFILSREKCTNISNSMRRFQTFQTFQQAPRDNHTFILSRKNFKHFKFNKHHP